MVQIVINVDDVVPVFAQIVTQVKNAVSGREIDAGDPLPSIRQLANDLGINQKTVAKAYRLLERDSVIQSKGYRGTFIHPNARVNSKIDLTQWTTTKLSEAVTELRSSGVTDSEIRIAMASILSTTNRGT